MMPVMIEPEPTPQTILGVWAHPDDEAFLSAGLMAKARAEGSRVFVLTATLGELGTPDPVAWPPARLAERRRGELSRSLAALGVEEHLVLGHRDGACDEVPIALGAEQVTTAIERIDPDVIVTFGPDGFTGHGDHRAVSAWVDDAVQTSGHRSRVWHATVAPGHLDQFADVHDRFDVFFAGRPSITAVEDMAAHLELDGPLLECKIEALTAQESQTGPLIEAMGIDRFRQWVAIESFREAQPGSPRAVV